MNKHEHNKNAWNEAAGFYEKALEKSVEFLKSGKISLSPNETKFLNDLPKWCEMAIHLQCAAGTDTLSLLNLGAKQVIGIDISDKMINLAQIKTNQLKMNAKWITSDILKISEDLNQTADLVYTGQGAINWIMDIQAWAKTVYRLLKPGGKFLLYEGHPVTYFFDTTTKVLTLDSQFEGYFANKVYENQGWTPEYVGDLGKQKSEHSVKFERAWPISDVINALLESGLTLKKFEEFPDAYWDEFPHLPDSERKKIPNTYCLWMTKQT